MTVGILIIVILAAVIVASFGVGRLYIWAAATDRGWEAFWLGFGTILMVGAGIGLVVCFIAILITTWSVPL